MFWQSVINGLHILVHWQTYAVGLMYFVITFLPVVPMVAMTRTNDGMPGATSLLLMFIQPVFQALAVFVAVCTLYPLMMGGTDAAWPLPWTLLATDSMGTLYIIGIMLVLSIIGSFLPILGSATSFSMFVMGGAVLVFLTSAMGHARPELGIQNVELIPGWPMIIGLVLAGGLASMLGLLASTAVAVLVFRDNEPIKQWVMATLGSVFGLIPIAMYAAWIALQIQASH